MSITNVIVLISIRVHLLDYSIALYSFQSILFTNLSKRTHFCYPISLARIQSLSTCLEIRIGMISSEMIVHALFAQQNAFPCAST